MTKTKEQIEQRMENLKESYTNYKVFTDTLVTRRNKLYDELDSINDTIQEYSNNINLIEQEHDALLMELERIEATTHA